MEVKTISDGCIDQGQNGGVTWADWRRPSIWDCHVCLKEMSFVVECEIFNLNLEGCSHGNSAA
jgi:hypothetical protein